MHDMLTRHLTVMRVAGTPKDERSFNGESGGFRAREIMVSPEPASKRSMPSGPAPRIASQRAQVTELTNGPGLPRELKTVVSEDLNVSGMVKNRKLARAFTDTGFGMLRAAIEYKAALRDGWVPFWLTDGSRLLRFLRRCK